MDKKNDIFAVIPAYNEAKNIIGVIKNLEKHILNIIVIDDGSADNTHALLKENFYGRIKILQHKINLGKGAAMKTGCEAALKLGAKIIIMIDGDGQHSPEDIPQMLNKLINKNLDIVFGIRRFDKNMPVIKTLGNKFLSCAINFFSHVRLDDTQSGFRAFTTKAYEKIRWVSTDYSIETEMIIRAGKHNLKYGAVPIQTIYMDNHKGTTPIDGIIIIFNLLKWRFLWF